MSPPGESRTPPDGARRITSALFLDFDNVYLGLRRLGEDVAMAFGRDPASWLARLEHGEDGDGPFVRRMLVRNCYLNPSTFADYRAPFTRAGFRVVDCPSLTQQGKSAADVNLVLDVLDVLQGPLHYDERGSVAFVLKGILYAGFTFDGGPDVHLIAEHWADNVVGLSRGARMELTEGDERVIRDWAGGGLA